jgi:amidase
MLKTPMMLYQLKRSWRQYSNAFQQYDVILSPVVSHVTPAIGYLAADLPFETQLQRLMNYITFTPANNAAGGPAISLPLARSVSGLPIGVQFSANHGDEKSLIELAFELEAAQPFIHLFDFESSHNACVAEVSYPGE